jgi:transcriptional/translational regulatory protein YebC/TACO1
MWVSPSFLFLLSLTRANSEAMTDNKARTVARIKALVSSAGGSFSRVLFNFVKKGLIIVRCDDRSFDEVLEEAIDLGADDVEAEDDVIKVDMW